MMLACSSEQASQRHPMTALRCSVVKQLFETGCAGYCCKVCLLLQGGVSIVSHQKSLWGSTVIAMRIYQARS